MQSDVIQWFPGHMAKTRRLISENLKEVDIVVEILDARIPYSSKNPEIAKIIGDKPCLTVLNKASLADKAITKKWIEYYKNQNKYAISVDCITGEGFSQISQAVKDILESAGNTVTIFTFKNGEESKNLNTIQDLFVWHL